ncbi:unnamed protein product, partial [Allacma fusca]
MDPTTSAITQILQKFQTQSQCSYTVTIFGTKPVSGNLSVPKLEYLLLFQMYIPILISQVNIPAFSNNEMSRAMKEQYFRIVCTSTRLTRHFGNCEGAVLNVEDAEFPRDFSSRGDLVNGSRNTGPFFFLGTLKALTNFLQSKPVKKLKWVFGFVSTPSQNDGSVLEGSVLTQFNGRLFHLRIDEFTPHSSMKFNLGGYFFPCSAIPSDTFVRWDSEKKPFMGTFYKAMEAASIVYNFSFSINLPPGGRNQLPNGTWPGAVGDILCNDKEILLGFGHTLQRAEALDFTSLF